jgi:L-asparaginase
MQSTASPSPSHPSTRVVILATGGTIAGRAARADDALGYRAGVVDAQALVDAVPALAAWPLAVEPLAQVDSKDMDFALWQRLARRAAMHLADASVAGVVVTHGTDTLEETAWFLHRVLAPARPLVLTAAMRPASSLQSDGPQNLLDAVTLAATPGARGVVVAFGGAVHAAGDLRKVHTLRLDAFSSGDAGPLARIDAGVLRRFRAWPGDGAAVPAADAPLGLEAISADPARWPWVAVLASHAGADGREVRALVAAGVQGLVVAGTGHGTLAAPLAGALEAAQAAGVRVRRVSRCAFGPVHGSAADEVLPAGGERSPWQARIDLILELLAAG